MNSPLLGLSGHVSAIEQPPLGLSEHVWPNEKHRLGFRKPASSQRVRPLDLSRSALYALFMRSLRASSCALYALLRALSTRWVYQGTSGPTTSLRWAVT